METTINIPDNINLEQYKATLGECLKYTSEFGGTVYNNICTGETYYVPFGFWDFFLATALALLGIGVVLLIGTAVYRFISDNY